MFAPNVWGFFQLLLALSASYSFFWGPSSCRKPRYMLTPVHELTAGPDRLDLVDSAAEAFGSKQKLNEIIIVIFLS